jgi:hypothetical protein
MNLKVRILKMLILLIFLWVAGDRMFSNLIEHSVFHLSENRFARMYTGRAKADVLMLGNSRLDRHFDPSILKKYFNKSAVNLGIGGQSTELSNLLLHDYIDRYGAPKILILEPTNACVRNGAIKDLRVFINHSDRIKNFVKKELPSEYYYGNIAHLYNFNNVMFNRILFEIFRPDKDRLRKDTISLARYNKIRSVHNSKRERMTSRLGNYSALESIAKICIEHNIDLRIVIVPDLRMAFASEKYKAWIDELETVFGPENIFDHSTSLVDRRYYFDENHLSEKGVYKLYEILSKDGFFS